MIVQISTSRAPHGRSQKTQKSLRTPLEASVSFLPSAVASRYHSLKLIFSLAFDETYTTGSEARKAIGAGGSAQGKFKVVEGDASVDVGIQNNFKEDRAYEMFSYNDVQILAKFSDYAGQVKEDLLITMLRRAGPWNPDDVASLQNWRSFYNSFGTHVIIGVQYGSRLSFVNMSTPLLRLCLLQFRPSGYRTTIQRSSTTSRLTLGPLIMV